MLKILFASSFISLLLASAFAHAEKPQVILCGRYCQENGPLQTLTYGLYLSTPFEGKYDVVRIPPATSYDEAVRIGKLMENLVVGQFYCMEGTIARTDGTKRPYLNPTKIHVVSSTLN